MKFTVSQSSLMKALTVVAKGMGTNSTLPILSGVYVRAQEGSLEFQTNNLTISIRHLIPANVEEPGETVVSGKVLTGIVKALPLLAPADDPRLCDEPFFVLAGDVVHAFDLRRFDAAAEAMRAGRIDAHLVAVPNPDFHAAGDMTVAADGTIVPGPGPHTYGCLMLASPRIFRPLRPEPAKLFPWLWDLALSGRVTAEVYTGFWDNVGSPREYERLKADAAALAWARY